MLKTSSDQTPRASTPQLAAAHRALAAARESGDPAAEAIAHCRIHDARRALGAESASWWQHV